LISRGREVRHLRVLNIRSKISRGWNRADLLDYCNVNLGVSKLTAVSYIDEAAEPYREKYQKEQNVTS